ncbi:MAG: hypothetical protein HY719_12475, partial [Planctomycetes bacterium]|nr:hypothetical protein [Planctomycetota bacterium]
MNIALVRSPFRFLVAFVAALALVAVPAFAPFGAPALQAQEEEGGEEAATAAEEEGPALEEVEEEATEPKSDNQAAPAKPKEVLSTPVEKKPAGAVVGGAKKPELPTPKPKGEVKADAAALALLKELAAGLNEKVLGKDEMVIRMGEDVIGVVDCVVEKGEQDGKKGYKVAMTGAMDMMGIVSATMSAKAFVTADLVTLSAETSEVMEQNGEKKSKQGGSTFKDGQYQCWKQGDGGGPVEKWTVKPVPGFLPDGVDILVQRFVGRSGKKEGTYTFVADRHGDFWPVKYELKGAEKVKTPTGEVDAVV